MDSFDRLLSLISLIPMLLIFLRIEHRLTKFEESLENMCSSCDRIKPGDERLLKLRPYVPGLDEERRHSGACR